MLHKCIFSHTSANLAAGINVLPAARRGSQTSCDGNLQQVYVMIYPVQSILKFSVFHLVQLFLTPFGDKPLPYQMIKYECKTTIFVICLENQQIFSHICSINLVLGKRYAKLTWAFIWSGRFSSRNSVMMQALYDKSEENYWVGENGKIMFIPTRQHDKAILYVY